MFENFDLAQKTLFLLGTALFATFMALALFVVFQTPALLRGDVSAGRLLGLLVVAAAALSSGVGLIELALPAGLWLAAIAISQIAVAIGLLGFARQKFFT